MGSLSTTDTSFKYVLWGFFYKMFEEEEKKSVDELYIERDIIYRVF